jgi:predicted RNA-binding protein (virulence factor B family)
MNHQFLIMWDQLGLECCIDVTADQQRRMWQKLKGEQVSETAIPNYQHLLLRARVNSQRHYEIYTCEAVDGITAEDIREMFEASPQSAADTIRRLGHCMHSDRATNDRVLIT